MIRLTSYIYTFRWRCGERIFYAVTWNSVPTRFDLVDLVSDGCPRHGNGYEASICSPSKFSYARAIIGRSKAGWLPCPCSKMFLVLTLRHFLISPRLFSASKNSLLPYSVQIFY